jgi:hypothetical protein
MGGVYRVRRAEASNLRALRLNARFFALFFKCDGTRLAFACQHPTFCPMKRLCFAVLLAIIFLALSPSPAQTPGPKADEQEFAALVKDVQTQQAQIVANQVNIDSKLGQLTETIRVARIFAGRSE